MTTVTPIKTPKQLKAISKAKALAKVNRAKATKRKQKATAKALKASLKATAKATAKTLQSTIKCSCCGIDFLRKANAKTCPSCRLFTSSFGKWFTKQLIGQPYQSAPTLEELTELIPHVQQLKDTKGLCCNQGEFTNSLNLDIAHLQPSKPQTTKGSTTYPRAVKANYMLMPTKVNRSVKDTVIPTRTNANSFTTTAPVKLFTKANVRQLLQAKYGADNLLDLVRQFKLKPTKHNTNVPDFNKATYYMDYIVQATEFYFSYSKYSITPEAHLELLESLNDTYVERYNQLYTAYHKVLIPSLRRYNATANDMTLDDFVTKCFENQLQQSSFDECFHDYLYALHTDSLLSYLN